MLTNSRQVIRAEASPRATNPRCDVCNGSQQEA